MGRTPEYFAPFFYNRFVEGNKVLNGPNYLSRVKLGIIPAHPIEQNNTQAQFNELQLFLMGQIGGRLPLIFATEYHLAELNWAAYPHPTSKSFIIAGFPIGAPLTEFDSAVATVEFESIVSGSSSNKMLLWNVRFAGVNEQGLFAATYLINRDGRRPSHSEIVRFHFSYPVDVVIASPIHVSRRPEEMYAVSGVVTRAMSNMVNTSAVLAGSSATELTDGLQIYPSITLTGRLEIVVGPTNCQVIHHTPGDNNRVLRDIPRYFE